VDTSNKITVRQTSVVCWKC